jgi:asparagine synthase (glutamine-hydrolysing)
MCGIWGKVTRDREIRREDLLGPIRKLAHRGPDGYGWFLQKDVALVHTRLSIVDLSGGAQPLISFDRRYIGVVNGELYDYDQHRERLIAQGVPFKTKSDSEVLLNLFATGGAAALSPLSGEYAFIFYDLKEKKIHFGRDLHGVKPLFMRREGGSLTLGSEIKSLQEGTPQLDETYVKRYLARIMVPPRTAISGAFHVLPGRVYTFDPARDELTWKRFQKIPLGRERVLKGPEALEKIGHELSAAVKRRLVADVEVGCYLSGGIDSALVTALMVQHGAKPKAFTVGFNEDKFDETARAAAIASHLGVEHHKIQLSGGTFLHHLKRSIVAFENPVANPHGAAKNILSKLAASQVKVVLTGEGADEWFSGYPYMRLRKLQAFAARHPRISQGAVAKYLALEGGIAKNSLDGKASRFDARIAPLLGGFVPAVYSRIPRDRLRRFYTGSDSDRPVMEAIQDFATYLDEDLLEGGRVGEMDLNVWAGCRMDMLHYILGNLGDRQEMSHSLEGRTPFLDQALVTAAAQVHPDTLLRGLTEKHVLRQIARPLLPRESAEQKKHPFFAPVRYLFLRAVRAEMDDGVRGLEKHAPWLPWKNFNHLFFGQKNADLAKQPMRDEAVSMKLVLFSLATLVDQLHTPQLAEVRGYTLPETVDEIAGREFKLG